MKFSYYFLIFCAFIGLGSLSLYLYQHRTLDYTCNASWKKAISYVEQQYDSNEIVVVYPPHFHSMLSHIPQHMHAASAVPIEKPRQRRYLGVWVISADESWPAELNNTAHKIHQKFENIIVGHFVYQGEQKVLFDAIHNFNKAHVSMLKKHESLMQCNQQRSDGGWQCPAQPHWNYVGPTRQTIGTQQELCLWMHPINNAEVAVTYDNVQLGKELIVRTALSDYAAKSYGADVDLKVSILAETANDADTDKQSPEVILEASINHPHTKGFLEKRFSINDDNKQVQLEFRVTTKNDGRRHFCIQAMSYDENAQLSL